MNNSYNLNDDFAEHQEFIVAEFNYMAQTAFQAQEDRARVSEFFLVSFGTFIAAVFSSQSSNPDPKLINNVFLILFIVVAFLGLLTTLELSRLRLAWTDSVRAMNCMKDFLINKHPALDACLPWRTKTIPKPFKLWSVGFMKALQVSLISGVSMGATLTFLRFSSGIVDVNWYLNVLVAIFTTFLYMFLFYYLPLRNK